MVLVVDVWMVQENQRFKVELRKTGGLNFGDYSIHVINCRP